MRAHAVLWKVQYCGMEDFWNQKWKTGDLEVTCGLHTYFAWHTMLSWNNDHLKCWRIYINIHVFWFSLKIKKNQICHLVIHFPSGSLPDHIRWQAPCPQVLQGLDWLSYFSFLKSYVHRVRAPLAMIRSTHVLYKAHCVFKSHLYADF